MADLILRVDSGLLALLDHEVMTARHVQAVEAAKTGANPKKPTRMHVVRELLTDGLRRRFEERGEEFPSFEHVGRKSRKAEPSAAVAYVEGVFAHAALEELCRDEPAPPPPAPILRRLGVPRRPNK